MATKLQMPTQGPKAEGDYKVAHLRTRAEGRRWIPPPSQLNLSQSHQISPNLISISPQSHPISPQSHLLISPNITSISPQARLNLTQSHLSLTESHPISCNLTRSHLNLAQSHPISPRWHLDPTSISAPSQPVSPNLISISHNLT